MNPTRRFLTRLTIFLLVLLGTSGCASLFNPHLNLERGDFQTGGPSMVEAIKYTDDTIAAYRQGMGDQANLSTWTGVVLIPLSAATVALGIQGGHTNAITNLALGGAATYGLSSWLSSPNRSLIYAEGIGAMNCAKQVMLPYYVSKPWMEEFSNALTKLSNQGSTLATQLAKLRALTSTLEGLIPIGANDDQVKKAKALADDVTHLLATTAVTRGNGFVLKRRLELAGQTLVFAVDRIAGEVDKALLSTVPSLTALSGIIASLNPAADMFRQAPTPAVPETQPKDDVPKFLAETDESPEVKEARAALSAKVLEVEFTFASLASAEATVSAAVVNFEQPISTAALKQCGVSEKDIIKPLRVQPSNHVTMTAGETKSVFLTGGSGQYAATATGEVKGLTVTQPIPLGEAVQIATTSETPDTTTSVLVKDVAGQSAIIELTITTTDKGGTNGGAGGGSTPGTTFDPRTPFEKGLGINRIQHIQTALHICNKSSDIKIDGILGDDTRAAAKKCPEVGSKVFDEDNVKKLTDKYLEDGLPKPGAQTDFEEMAPVPVLQDVYKKVGIQPVPDLNITTNRFSKKFRIELRKFQKAHDVGISGLYTKDFPK